MNKKKWLLAALLCILTVTVLTGLGIHYQTQIDLKLQEWKYQLSDRPEDLLRLSLMAVLAEEEKLIYRYVLEALQIEDFDGCFNRCNFNASEEAADAENLYTLFLAEQLLAPLYVEKYDEFSVAFPARFEELMQRDAGDNYFCVVLSRAEDTTQDEYELILQSLSSACPEKPELTADNAEAIDYYLKIREVLATTYLYMGDGDTYISMRDDNQRISEELKDIMNAT